MQYMDRKTRGRRENKREAKDIDEEQR